MAKKRGGLNALRREEYAGLQRTNTAMQMCLRYASFAAYAVNAIEMSQARIGSPAISSIRQSCALLLGFLLSFMSFFSPSFYRRSAFLLGFLSLLAGYVP